MADSYTFVKGGKLKLKGEKRKSHKKHKKEKRQKKDNREEDVMVDEDTLKNGGWWEVKEIEEITGPIAIEMGAMTYIQALDNGLFTLGAPHDVGEGPNPEEILTAVKANDREVALKSGYDKYLSVGPGNKVVGRSDAISSKEQWEPIFQEGKVAIVGSNSCFISMNSAGDLVCSSTKAGSEEFVKIRSCAKKVNKAEKEIPKEETGKVKDTEINYVKKFQSFQDRRLRVSEKDKTELKAAKKEGNFHEVLLDRRSKMKADRYCK